MPDTTARIRAKGTDSTGLTEEDARRMHGEVGKHYMAIVELKVAQKHGPDAEGQRGVDLTIEQLEPAERGSDLEAHLRELTRTVYQNRALNSEDQQLQIETAGDLERSVPDVIAAGKAHEPHTFEPDETTPTACNICGAADEDPRHHADDQEPADEEPADEAGDQPDEPDTVPVEEPANDEPEQPEGDRPPSNVVGFSSREYGARS